MSILSQAPKKLNEIIPQYFYSLFLYKDVILYRRDDDYKLHIRNAEKGDNVSQYYVGNSYRYGSNVEHDYNKSFEWYTKSSEGGNIRATYELGNYYNVMANKKKAFELYLNSAEGGYKYASCAVGDCYNFGDGISIDKNRSFEWYLRAAKNGYAYCQFLMANFYDNGIYISKNEEKGF